MWKMESAIPTPLLKFVSPETSTAPLRSVAPATVSAPPTVAPTPRISCEPSNTKFELSSNSPPVPAMTTRLLVRSSTLKVFA